MNSRGTRRPWGSKPASSAYRLSQNAWGDLGDRPLGPHADHKGRRRTFRAGANRLRPTRPRLFTPPSDRKPPCADFVPACSPYFWLL